jgi:hypothetical protein
MSAPSALAQPAPGGAAKDTTAKTPAAAQPAAPTFAFSGLIFANYQYGGARGNRSTNRFDVERAYLNFRARPAERDSIRVTADVFQQRDTTRDAYYRGWAFRAKYAYLQHEFLRGGEISDQRPVGVAPDGCRREGGNPLAARAHTDRCGARGILRVV